MAAPHKYVEDFENLLDPGANTIFNMSPEEVEAAVRSGDPGKVRRIDGSFVIAEKKGKEVFLARSIGRPMRYFLAKQASGHWPTSAGSGCRPSRKRTHLPENKQAARKHVIGRYSSVAELPGQLFSAQRL